MRWEVFVVIADDGMGLTFYRRSQDMSVLGVIRHYRYQLLVIRNQRIFKRYSHLLKAVVSLLGGIASAHKHALHLLENGGSPPGHIKCWLLGQPEQRIAGWHW